MYSFWFWPTFSSKLGNKIDAWNRQQILAGAASRILSIQESLLIE
jgi:hypothetical protein